MTSGRPRLALTDAGDRDDAGAFVARVVRLDGAALVRLRSSATNPLADPTPGRTPGRASDRSADRTTMAPRLQMWAGTPFDALVTRSVSGVVDPADVTVHAANLLPGLTVARGDDIDTGPAVDQLWRTQLPPLTGWSLVDTVPATVVTELTDAGVRSARTTASPVGGTSAALLDSPVLTVAGAGFNVPIPMRCLFALAGMGFATEDGDVRVYATDSWVRLDARFGAVVRRRHALLPLVF